MSRYVVALAFGLGALVVAREAPASACSPALCPFESPQPSGTEGAPAHLPANGVTIATFAQTGSTLEIERVRDGESVMLPMDDPTAPLVTLTDVVAGDLLRITATHVCLQSPETPQIRTTVISVTETAPLPTALGALESIASRGPVEVWDNRGSCTSPIDSARVDYALVPDASLAPWADAIELVALVNDATASTGLDGRIFHACVEPLPSQEGLHDFAAGTHRIRMTGRIRGTDVSLATDEISVMLECGGPSTTCSASAGHPASRAPWLGALVALALVASRRRRRCIANAMRHHAPHDCASRPLRVAAPSLP